MSPFTLAPNLSAQFNGGALGLQLLAFSNKKFAAAQAATRPAVGRLGCLSVNRNRHISLRLAGSSVTFSSVTSVSRARGR